MKSSCRVCVEQLGRYACARLLAVYVYGAWLKENATRAHAFAMAAGSLAPAATEQTGCRSYQFKLSEYGGSGGPTEEDIAAATDQVSALDTRKKACLKASIRHYLSRNSGEAMRQASGRLDYDKMLPLWLAHTAKDRETQNRLRTSKLEMKKIKVPAAPKPRALPKYCARLGAAAGVEPSTVHLIVESLRTLAIEALERKKPFVLPDIARFSRIQVRGKAAHPVRFAGAAYDAKATPASCRARCVAARKLQRAVLAPSPCAPAATTPAVKAFCGSLAAAAGDAAVTLDLVASVIAELRTAIIQDLRAAGAFVLDGFVRFKVVDVPARHAEYLYNASLRKTILHKDKAACRCVHSRVQPRLQQVFARSRQKGLKRRTLIRRAVELRMYGFTDGCPGCEAAASGSKALGHSEACRRRIEAKMLADEVAALAVVRAQMRRGQADSRVFTAKQAYRKTAAEAEQLLLKRAAAAAAAVSVEPCARRRRRCKGP